MAIPRSAASTFLQDLTLGRHGIAWAVGASCMSRCYTATETDRTLILRWDGTTWSQTPSPSPGGAAYLHGATSGPGGTAWAVGDSCLPGCNINSTDNRTLVLRWDGNRWSRTPSPSPGGSAYLYSVAASPRGTAWAVGEYCASGCGTAAATWRTLILHWDGTRWSRTPSPSPGRRTFLNEVIPAHGGTAWAVGTSCFSRCGTTGENGRTLILHWDGANWSQVPGPSPGPDPYLTSVSTAPGGTLWAVGFTCRFCIGSRIQTLILHWDGTSWTRVASPSPAGDGFLNGVTAGPRGTAWAVGYTCTSACRTEAETDRTLTLHWDGTRWTAG